MLEPFRPRVRNVVVAALGAALLAGCPSTPKPDPKPEPKATDAGSTAMKAATVDALPNPGHGKELVLSFQCNRCHDGTGHPAAADGKHCVHCHKNIIDDKFQGSAASIARWKPRVKELADAPSLEAIGKRFTRVWVERYLLQPYDLRPELHQYMPRLALRPEDARDIAAYLVPDPDPPSLGPPEIAAADLGKGRQLLETKSCGICHAFTGVASVPASPTVTMTPSEMRRGHKLAPDLRFARERMPPARMVAWLKDPASIKPDTAMHIPPLSDVEAKDLAAYILTAELAPPPAKPNLLRLPVLTRKVTFKEVDEKVFHRTCWHCHSEPDYAIGDGGPGNSGGFGFRPRGLNLSDYGGIAAGYLDDKGERASIFAKDAENVPRIVRALLARHDEESGAETGPVRGMPLGYEPLSAEDIQLVETWVSQGRPR